jgi:hypothetical protein
MEYARLAKKLRGSLYSTAGATGSGHYTGKNVELNS